MEGSLVVRNWISMLLKGVLGLAFGIVMLVWPDITFKVIIKLFGVFALLFGLLWAVVFCAEVMKKKKWGWSLALALVGIFFGVIALARTYEMAALIAFFFVAWLLVAGAIEMTAANLLPLEFKYRWLLMAEGLLSIVIGLCLMLFTKPTAMVIVVLVGVYFVVMGLIDIVVGVMMRKFFKESTEVVVVSD